MIQACPAYGCADEIDQDNDCEPAKRDKFRVLPPHPPPDSSTTLPEGARLGGEVIGLVNEEVEPFATGQDLFDILDHDVFDVLDFGLGVPHGVVWR